MKDELNKKAQEDINRILAEVDAATPAPDQTHDATAPTEEAVSAPKRVIDIHVYELAGGEESPPVEEEQQETSIPEPAEPPRRSRRRALFLLLGGLCLLFVAALVTLVLSPLLVAEATITIIPASKQISTTSTVIVATGQSTAGAELIPGSMLAPVSMSQAKTVTTTGRSHQDARSAYGLVTFYNAAPYAQTVSAGTLLTGAGGVQVVTDQNAVIPAGNLATNGQTTVSAHAVQTGLAGNIQASDIYGACCRVNVFVANGVFTGGQEARDFQSVTRADINTAVSNLKSSLDQSIQAALKTQVATDQTLITPPACQQSITPDHQVGEEATHVHVVLSETCAGATYNTQSFERLVTQQMNQQARGQLGRGYAQTGIIESRIETATPKVHGAITLLVESTASYAYQFTEQQQQTMKAAIAGKSKAQATSILLQLGEVQSVSFSLNYGEQLPTDPGRIHLVFLVTS